MSIQLTESGISPGHQRGAALAVSLLLLLVLTILSIAALNSTGLQERMAFNLRESNMAFQAAEAALLDGETWLGSPVLAIRPIPQTCTSNCAAGIPVWAVPEVDWAAQTDAWWTSNGRQYNFNYTTGTDGPDLPQIAAASQPRYIIQEAGSRPDSLVAGAADATYFYTVTARGVGRIGAQDVILQTMYSRRF
jgi:type IV pilus assembly protein PilX